MFVFFFSLLVFCFRIRGTNLLSILCGLMVRSWSVLKPHLLPGKPCISISSQCPWPACPRGSVCTLHDPWSSIRFRCDTWPYHKIIHAFYNNTNRLELEFGNRDLHVINSQGISPINLITVSLASITFLWLQNHDLPQ